MFSVSLFVLQYYWLWRNIIDFGETCIDVSCSCMMNHHSWESFEPKHDPALKTLIIIIIIICLENFHGLEAQYSESERHTT